MCWFVCLLSVLPYTLNVHIRWLYAFIKGNKVATAGDIAYAPNPAKNCGTKSSCVHCVCAKPRKKCVTKLQRRHCIYRYAYAPNPAKNCATKARRRHNVCAKPHKKIPEQSRRVPDPVLRMRHLFFGECYQRHTSPNRLQEHNWKKSCAKNDVTA